MDLSAYLSGLGMLLSGMLITASCVQVALRRHRKRQAIRLLAASGGKA